jgi:hypothetical protein
MHIVGVQAEASALAQPQLEGADVDCSFKGLDVLPLLSPGAALERGAAAQPQRLRLNGRTKVSVRLAEPATNQAQEQQREEAGGSTEGAAPEQAVFTGELSLEGLRVNQLKLSRSLGGSLSLSKERFHISAKVCAPCLLHNTLFSPDEALISNSVDWRQMLYD